jgi:DNA polymerase-3 subunit alpha (Gram-positive type)
MKLCMRNLELPIKRLLSNIVETDSSVECEGIEVSEISIDCDSKEIMIKIGCEVSIELKDFLESAFLEKASQFLKSSVRLYFQPVESGAVKAGEEIPEGVSDTQFREILKLTNGASSYLASSEMAFSDDRILITVHDQFSFQRISAKKQDLRKAIEKVCMRAIPFEIILDIRDDQNDLINEEVSRREVEKETTVSSSEVDSVLMGREIRAVSKKMKEVLGNESDLVVRGKIFGLEYRNGKIFILTFNVTDHTDSLTVKLIGENARSLSEKLREGDEITIRGKMETDSWMKDEILIPRDIQRTALPKRVDESRLWMFENW